MKESNHLVYCRAIHPVRLPGSGRQMERGRIVQPVKMRTLNSMIVDWRANPSLGLTVLSVIGWLLRKLYR